MNEIAIHASVGEIVTLDPGFPPDPMSVRAAQQAVIDAALDWDEKWRTNHAKEYQVGAAELNEARAELNGACAHLRMCCEALRNTRMES